MTSSAQEKSLNSELENKIATLANLAILNLEKATTLSLVCLLTIEMLALIAVSSNTSFHFWDGKASPFPKDCLAVSVFGVVLWLPVLIVAVNHPGKSYTKTIIAVGMMLLSMLFAHVTAGAFRDLVFLSFAFVGFYFDATLVFSSMLLFLAAMFFFRGFSPGSIFSAETSNWTWIAQTTWFLLLALYLSGQCFVVRKLCRSAAVDSCERIFEIDGQISELEQAELELAQQRSRIAQIVDILAKSGKNISMLLSELSSNAQDTFSAVVETTHVAEEVRQTAEVSMQSAKAVLEDSQSVIITSEKGQSATVEAVTGIQKVAGQITSISESLVKLGNQSKTIAEVIQTLDDLARQTNLLSVSASIEAAKAGSHGQSFALAAQEVKQLSLQSKEATKRVVANLNEIALAASLATKDTELGLLAVSSCESVVADAQESITLLARSVAQSGQAAEQIEISNQQQLIGMEQVVQAMEEVRIVSDHTVERAREVELCVKDLNDLNSHLEDLLALPKKAV